jgi:hypothetical protein
MNPRVTIKVNGRGWQRVKSLRSLAQPLVTT